MWYRLYRSIGRMTHSFRSSIYLDFYRFLRFASEDTSVHQTLKTEFMQTVNFFDNWAAIESRRIKQLSFFKKSSKKSYLFFKTRFKIFLGLLILASFVGAQFFTIEICYPFKLTSLQFRVYHPGSWRFFFKVNT